MLSDHVWREGMADWSQLQYVEELMGPIRRAGSSSGRPPGPASVSRPPGVQPGRASAPVLASQPRYSQRPEPRQSLRPQPLQSQRPEPRQSLQPQSLQSYRSLPVQSQRPQAMQGAPDDRLNSYDSQSLARLASSPSLPPVAPATLEIPPPPGVLASPRVPRLDPGAEAAVRAPSIRPQRQVSERPAAAAAPRTSVPATAPPAARASRTSLVLASASGLVIVGLAAASAIYILRPAEPAPAPAGPVAAPASPPAAPSPVPAAPPTVQEQEAAEPPEEEAAQGEAEEQSQTFVFGLDEQLAETGEGEGEGAPGTGSSKKRTRAGRSRIRASKPSGEAASPAERTTPSAAAETDLQAGGKPEDTGQPEGTGQPQAAIGGEDLFAEPIKTAPAGAAEKPAEPGAEEKKPPPDPNRSIDDLLDLAVSDQAKSKPAKPAPDVLPAEPSREQILSALRAVLPAAKACGQGAGGTAQSQITVAGSTGQAVDVKVTGVDEAVGTCVGNALRRARFPRFSKPTFNVSYPVRL